MNSIPINHKRWCGAKRCEVSLRIYESLRNQGVTGKDIAQRVGVSRQAVTQVINGVSHSPRILEALRIAGVPEKYLFDPNRVIFEPKQETCAV